MIRSIIALLIIAIIAGVLGFGGVAAAAAGMAKIVFWIAIVFLIGSIVRSLASKSA